MEAELAFDASFFKANRKVDSPTFIEKLSIFQLFAQKKACTLNGDLGPLGKTRKKTPSTRSLNIRSGSLPLSYERPMGELETCSG